MAFVASLLASFLCCTPIVPSLLAFVGISGMGLYTTTGTLQHVFAVRQSEFLAASLVLLAAMCWWGLRKLARSQCFAAYPGAEEVRARGSRARQGAL
ncbi:MAG: hypothetical protein M0Z95_15300 [Actinomycetota bacterium]|nr:hypothetical protein [Actinomycetota bacterium]